MTTVQIRVDQKIKNKARKVFDKLGTDMTGAITLFLYQVAIRQEIPFRLITENGFTPEDEKAILKASAEAKMGVNVTPVMNVKEALEYLKNL